MHRTVRRSVIGTRALLVAALAVAVTASPGSPAAAAPGPAPGSGPDTGLTVPDPATHTESVTLVTGDTVAVSTLPGGQRSARLIHAAPRPDGLAVAFTSLTTPDGDLYVIPSDAAAAISAHRVDRALFDVSYLVDNGYGDKQTTTVPVIAQYGAQIAAASLAPKADALPATGAVHPLWSIDGAAVSVAKKDVASFWASVRGPQPAAGQARLAPAGTLGAGLTTLWLDRKVHVNLDQSVPQIGAPEAWAAGYDGTGVKVAVLDTGVDATHPDLAGTIIESRSFVPGVDTATDGHGHGTHVASTIVGSGAASDGKYRGVAPGAKLIIGKVLDDDGFGADSGIIEGMQWAAQQGARIVSMSLGTELPADDTGPMSLALNEITESTGTLFVVAAGNSGPAASTIGAPGSAADALTVAAVDKQDNLASFSSRGPVLRSLALKPDIAAPGVNITAARAAGTSHGTVVNDFYTTMSGTSMATPHVSGSAAILAQVHPDWRAPQLKAALMASARDDGYGVYEQGTGRVDIPHAITQTLLPDTASVDFGTLPISSTESATRTVTLTNTAATDATVSVSTHISGPGGQASDRITVSPGSATVPAGGSTTLTITLDPAGAGRGSYSGAIQVTGGTPGSTVRLAVGGNVIPPSHVLRLRTIAPDDWPAPNVVAGGNLPWFLLPVDQPGDFLVLASGPDQQYLVPDGVYAAWTGFNAYFDQRTGENAAAVLIDPEVKVLGADAEVTLDAHDAKPLTVRTDKPTHQDVAAFGIARGTAYGGRWVLSNPTSGDQGSIGWGATGSGLRVTPTTPVTVGTMSTMVGAMSSEPLVTLNVGHGRRATTFRPTYPDVRYGSSWTNKLDLRGDVDLVDVGAGTPAEIAAHDLRGRIAVLSRPFDVTGLATVNNQPALDILAPLRDAGALAAVVFMDAGRPSWCALGGCEFIQARHTPVPVLTLGPAQGAKLRALLTDGSASARIDARTHADYNYVLRFADDSGVVPADPTYHVAQDELASVHTRYHADVPSYLEEVFQTTAPDGMNPFFGRFTASQVESTQYIGPADPDVLWRRITSSEELDNANIIDALVFQQFEYYPQPTESTVDVFGAPAVPGTQRLDDRIIDRFGDVAGLCAYCRSPHLFIPFPLEMWSEPGQRGEVAAESRQVHLYRGGAEVASAFPGAFFYDLSDHPEAERYRLTMSRTMRVPSVTHATQVDTAWEYTSQGPTTTAPQGYECIDKRTPLCRVEPMLLLRYDLGDAIGLDNTAPAPGMASFTITGYHQGGAPDSAVRALHLSVSFDHGAHWQPAVTVPRGHSRFQAFVAHPRDATGTVSLRVEAADTAGNTVTQTVYDAYGLRARQHGGDGLARTAE